MKIDIPAFKHCLIGGTSVLTAYVLATVYDKNLNEPPWWGIFAVICFVLSVLLLVIFIVFCIRVLKTKTSEDQIEQSEIKTDTLIHFHHISSLSFQVFNEKLDSETDEDYMKDFRSQICINAKRAMRKTKIIIAEYGLLNVLYL